MGSRRRNSRSLFDGRCTRLERLEARTLLSGTGIARPVPNDAGENLATVFLSESADQSTYGAGVTFVAHVIASTPAEGCVVDFVDNTGSGAVVIGTGSVANGMVSFVWNGATAGMHQITAQLEGGQAVAGLPSAPQVLAVSKGTPVTGLAQVGGNVVATVTVNGAAVTAGSVSFFEGTKVVATVAVGVDGTAAFSAAKLGAGTHSIVAAFNGSSQVLPGVSGELVVVQGGAAGGTHGTFVVHGRGHWAVAVERPAVRKVVHGARAARG